MIRELAEEGDVYMKVERMWMRYFPLRFGVVKKLHKLAVWIGKKIITRERDFRVGGGESKNWREIRVKN